MDDELVINGVTYVRKEPEPAFKVGDRVEATKDDGKLQAGSTGTVIKYNNDDDLLVKFDNGTRSQNYDWWCAEYQLRRIDTPAPEPEPRFKFGDRVMVGDCELMGIVIDHDRGDKRMEYHVAMDGGLTYWYAASSLAPAPIPQRIELKVGMKVKCDEQEVSITKDEGGDYLPMRTAGYVRHWLPRVIEVVQEAE